MPKAYSKDLRERIVLSYNNGEGTIEKIAKTFKLSGRTVSKYLKLHRTTGDLTPGQSTGRPKFLTDEVLTIIEEIVLQKPDARLEDYCEKFLQQTGTLIPKSTLWDACQILNINRKKKFFCHRAGSL